MDEMTPEMIATHYTTAMDSVDLINDLYYAGNLSEDDEDTIARNKEHLEIMVAKDFWTDEDMTPLTDAIVRSE